MTDTLRYPIGPFVPKDAYTLEERLTFISRLESLPAALRAAVTGLTPDQLTTPYREGGWTVAQVVHHLADSHLSGFVRFKWALTEDNPMIKLFDQAAWASLPDGSAPETVHLSLALLDSLHPRFVHMLRSLDDASWARPYQHPVRGPMTLDRTLALYAWHGPHHTAHITQLKEKRRW
jgi:uncharacterized damage-inducible protein DinB